MLDFWCSGISGSTKVLLHVSRISMNTCGFLFEYAGVFEVKYLVDPKQKEKSVGKHLCKTSREERK
jgi:hypothetical protein